MIKRIIAEKTTSFRCPPPPYSSKGFRRFRLGFTLAEMLITLAIIGIIATLTVPTLMNKYQEHQTVVAVKEAYSILSNAFRMAQAEHGDFNTWDIGNGWITENHIKVMNYFLPYLKVNDRLTKNCSKDFPSSILSLDGSWSSGCLSNEIEQNYVTLQNGMRIIFFANNKQLFIVADINGKTKPNTFGKDVFAFSAAAQTNSLSPDTYKQSANCNIKAKHYLNGRSCAYWVIYKGNMDYLKRDVSAEW